MTSAAGRCAWASTPLLAAYHDAEWGVPQHDDRMLFEMLVLEGAQAGLSWTVVLRKREGYRAVFAGFDPAVVAGFDAARIEALVGYAGIVRHRGKIVAAVRNARAFLEVQRAFGSFDAYLWRFVSGVPLVVGRPAGVPAAARSALSDQVSADLVQRGFSFVGSTIMQAYLQATGVIDDHDEGCRARS